jgi:putative SOS response-associated peptidase YedK
MLTINADDHELFKNFHKPQDEKRMVVILSEDQFDDWLDAPAGRSGDFMRPLPAQHLEATADPARCRKTSQI